MRVGGKEDAAGGRRRRDHLVSRGVTEPDTGAGRGVEGRGRDKGLALLSETEEEAEEQLAEAEKLCFVLEESQRGRLGDG